MPKRTAQTLAIIERSAVRVEPVIAVNLNESAALMWALKKIRGLIDGRVVTVPAEHRGTISYAIDAAITGVHQGEHNATRAATAAPAEVHG